MIATELPLPTSGLRAVARAPRLVPEPSPPPTRQSEQAHQPLKVLVVSYAFPPTGGAGVQRVLKLVKYLPEHGVTPSVLTAENPSVPLSDASLERDLPSALELVRVPTLEPAYSVKRAAWHACNERNARTFGDVAKQALIGGAKQLLLPDPQVLWQPSAQAELARRLLGPRPDDVVFVSAPPFSQFLLAPLARLHPKTAVVLDYRDEWTTCRSSYEMTSTLAAKTGDLLEPQILRCAHAVITATEAFRAALLARFAFLSPERVYTIPNGWDADDLPDALPEPPSDRFVITYAGTIFRLTSARSLLTAVRLLHEREPNLARLLELRFLGRIVDTEADAFEGSEAFGVRRVGYVPHDQVIAELAASHLVLCLLDAAPGAERIYPAKIFEIMKLGRPCLTLAPSGALADLVKRHGLGEAIFPRNEVAIAEALALHLREFRDGHYDLRTNAVDIDQFERRLLAARFVKVMRQAVRDARG